MKIGLLIPFLDPTSRGVVVGGSANGMINLSRALASRGHSLDLIAGRSCSAAAQSRAGHWPWRSVTTVPIRSARATASYGAEFTLKCVVAALRRWRGNGLDVIHGHSGFGAYATTTTVVSALLGVPAVHTLYCPMSDRTDGRRSMVADLLERPVTFAGLRRVVAISDNVRASLLDRGVARSKIRLVPPAVDVARYRASSAGSVRQRLGLVESQPLVTYIGSLNPAKGLDFLLEAVARLAPAHPELRLVTAVEPGDARARSRSPEIAQRIGSLGLRSRVVELGVVPDMPDLLAASDVVVVPFLSTSGPSDYPLVMLEAMAAGTPVVATRVGGIPEVIREGETGLLCDPGSSEQLAAQIERLIVDRELKRRLGDGGAEAVAATFDASRVATAMEEVFGLAIGSGR